MSYSTEVLADTPKGYWACDEASGSTLADSSGNGLSFTISGTPSYRVAGPTAAIPYAIGFGSSSQATRAGIITTAVNNITIEFWLNIVNNIHTFPIFIGDYSGGTNGYDVEYSSSHFFTVCYGPFAQEANSVANPQGAWHHIVVVRDAGTWKYYVDGSLDTASAGTATPGTPTVGGRLGAALAGISMQICQVAVYESVLSPTRISAHYAAGRVITEAATVIIPISATGVEPAYVDSATAKIALTSSASEILTRQYSDSSTARLSITASGSETYYTPTFDVYITGTRTEGYILEAHSGLAPAEQSTVGVLQDVRLTAPTYDSVTLTFTTAITAGTFDPTKFTVRTNNGDIIGVTAAASPSGSGDGSQVELTLDRSVSYAEGVCVSYAP